MRKISRIGLRAKFILSISAVVILASVILSWVFIRNQVEQLRNALKERGKSLTKNLAYNSEYGVLTVNKEALITLIQGVIVEEDVVYCLIQDREGEVLALGSRPEGERIYKEIEEVMISKRIEKEELKIQFYRSPKGDSVYDVVSSIKTQRVKTKREEIVLAEPISEKFEEIIGSVRVGISLARVNQQINGLKRAAFGLTFFVIIIGILVAFLLLRVIVRPIEKLVLGTQKIAKGDLSYRVEVKSKDEIGDLAFAFNEMAEELKKSRDRIEDYSKTLEQKVEERTKQLKEAQTQLIQSAKMVAVGQLSAGIAHEINNPLAGILGYSQFILNKSRRTDFNFEDFRNCRDYLKHIERESQRCKKIVESLLSFSRRSTDAFQLLDVKSVMETTLSILKHPLELQNIKIETRYLSSEIPLIMGNANQLQQVFTNLIINAQHAMPEGGELKIDVEVTRGDENKFLRIALQDTGCGISKENLEKIFDPFFTTKQNRESIGLGLSISYQIIQQHKGRILVESEVGKGSTFTLILPYKS